MEAIVIPRLSSHITDAQTSGEESVSPRECAVARANDTASPMTNAIAQISFNGSKR